MCKLNRFFCYIICAFIFTFIPLNAEAEKLVLKIGVLPDADSLPLIVAFEEGLFQEAGVNVKLVSFKTAIERDSALQANAIDGAISDLLAAAFALQAGFEVRVTSLTDGRYGIVSAPNSNINKASDLKGVEIGLSTNTIIQYAVDSLLIKSGLVSSEIKGISVPKIPVRMELLLSGALKAACLPEPLLSAAQVRGAKLVAASDDYGLHAGVILFNKKVIDTRLSDLKAFYKAYTKAALSINGNQEKYRSFLVEKALFPVEVKDSYKFVLYAIPRLPSADDANAVFTWMQKQKLLHIVISPSLLFDGRAIEK